MTATVHNFRTGEVVTPRPPKITERVADLMAIALSEEDDIAFEVLVDAFNRIHQLKVERRRAWPAA